MLNESTMIKILTEKGMSDSYAQDFLNKNPVTDFKIYKEDEIKQKLNVVYNGDFIYGVLFCDGNSFYYSKLDDGFNCLFHRNSDQDYLDYVGKSIINTVYSEKFIKTVYNTAKTNDSLEKRIKIYRDVTKDAPGFHLK